MKVLLLLTLSVYLLKETLSQCTLGSSDACNSGPGNVSNPMEKVVYQQEQLSIQINGLSKQQKKLLKQQRKLRKLQVESLERNRNSKTDDVVSEEGSGDDLEDVELDFDEDLLMLSERNQKLKESQFPKDCSEIKSKDSGLYTVYPDHYLPVDVYCNQSTDGGGWTVIQRRVNGSESFFRKWISYSNGFGDLTHEFWLGNDNIAALTKQKMYTLRVDLEDFEGEMRYAQYTFFRVDDITNFYKLHLRNYSGDAGDTLQYHNGRYFSTADYDNDQSDKTNCAKEYKSGWWYRSCHHAHLNGKYTREQDNIGIIWWSWKGIFYSLKYAQMMIRPWDFHA